MSQTIARINTLETTVSTLAATQNEGLAILANIAKMLAVNTTEKEPKVNTETVKYREANDVDPRHTNSMNDETKFVYPNRQMRNRAAAAMMRQAGIQNTSNKAWWPAAEAILNAGGTPRRAAAAAIAIFEAIEAAKASK